MTDRPDDESFGTDVERDLGQFPVSRVVPAAHPSTDKHADSGQFPGGIKPGSGERDTSSPERRRPGSHVFVREEEVERPGADSGVDDVAPEAIARMKKGQRVGRFELIKAISGGKSRDAWIARDEAGTYVFLKLFDEMLYPEVGDPRYDALSRKFDEWEAHQRRVFESLQTISVGDGSLVLPIDQGRTNSGQQLYRVYPIVHEKLLHSPSRGSGLPELAGELGSLKSDIRESRERLLIVKALILGVWQLHRRGIVHGDIKPSNVLIQATSCGRVARLVDFDNCFFSGAPLNPSLMGGDERYFSPERSKFQEGDLEDRTQLTHKSDVYSLAQMVFDVFGHGRDSSTSTPLLNLGCTRLERALQKCVHDDPTQRPDAHHLLLCAGVNLKKKLIATGA